MGVLPLQFKDGVGRQTPEAHRRGDARHPRRRPDLTPRMELTLRDPSSDGKTREEPVLCRIDTLDEVEYFRHGGILQYVLREMAKAA